MFLDIGVGILAAILVSKLFSITLTYWFVAGGIVFALLMDADFIFHLWTGGTSKDVHRHRDLLHYPIVYIPFGSSIAYFLGGNYWALLFAICSFVHFLHDSIGIGWGVQWLWPFRNDHYTFFYAYQPPSRPPLPFQWVYIWKHDEIDKIEEKLGDHDWIKNIYLKWHPYAIVEFVVFLIALSVLLWR